MAAKKLPEGRAKTWKVIVRFSPNVKAVIRDEFARGGEKTISAFFRRIIWERCEPRDDKTSA